MPLQESTAFFSKRTDRGMGSLGSAGLGSLGALEESTADFSRRAIRGRMLRPIGDVSLFGATISTPMLLAGAAAIGLFFFLKRRK